MSDQPVPNPFTSARRIVGINVLLKPEDIMAIWSITSEQAELLINRHSSSIAVQMFAAGQKAVEQIIQQEGVPK